MANCIVSLGCEMEEILSTPARSDAARAGWGQPPWKIDFPHAPLPVPAQVDVAVVGAGFSGLAAAAWLRRLDPAKSVAVFEAQSIGSGSSGRTGGMVLAETAAGDLPGLGDVLAGFSSALRELSIDCDLNLSGAWEIGRRDPLPKSPIDWQDSGNLRATAELPGGAIDPGKLVAGLARTAASLGAQIVENAPIEDIRAADSHSLSLRVHEREVRASHAILATNAFSLELTGLGKRTEPKLTLAVATTPLKPADLEVLGLSAHRAFYTIDLPYLWGRVLDNNGVIFGGGIIEVDNWRGLQTLDISIGKPAELIAKVERRVRGLHPALRSIGFSHWWGGPVLFGRDWEGQPVFEAHASLPNTIVLGAYSGHGVALSVYLGCWAAEAVLGRKKLPSC
jgi:glycine/D-amino acid oxidase-like deaminating enzyme